MSRAAKSNHGRRAPATARSATAAAEPPDREDAPGGGGKPAPGVALLTVKQVAERLNVAVGTVYALCAAGKLEHVRVGAGRGTLRIEEEALQRFVQGATVRSKESTAPLPRTPLAKRPAITLKNLALS